MRKARVSEEQERGQVLKVQQKRDPIAFRPAIMDARRVLGDTYMGIHSPSHFDLLSP